MEQRTIIPSDNREIYDLGDNHERTIVFIWFMFVIVLCIWGVAVRGELPPQNIGNIQYELNTPFKCSVTIDTTTRTSHLYLYKSVRRKVIGWKKTPVILELPNQEQIAEIHPVTKDEEKLLVHIWYRDKSRKWFWISRDGFMEEVFL